MHPIAQDPLLRVEGLSKVFRSGEAQLVLFENLSFQVAKGTMLAIVGQSGAGTSYAKDCIPPENECNVTVVTAGSDGRTRIREGSPNPFISGAYSYSNASAGNIRAADHDG